MGKQDMTRVLCAYRTNLPGSAAEKLAQRADLESMLNQLEEEPLIFIVFIDFRYLGKVFIKPGNRTTIWC